MQGHMTFSREKSVLFFHGLIQPCHDVFRHLREAVAQEVVSCTINSDQGLMCGRGTCRRSRR